MDSFTIIYAQINGVTGDWNVHEITAQGEDKFTQMMLDFTWRVVRGGFVILSVTKAAGGA